jgi:hypothetical protein
MILIVTVKQKILICNVTFSNAISKIIISKVFIIIVPVSYENTKGNQVSLTRENVL